MLQALPQPRHTRFAIALEGLPADVPDLNPDAGMWQDLKYVELRNVGC